MTNRLSSFLNTARWWAAFAVLAAHTRHLVMVDAAHLERRGLLNKALYFVTGLGHEAVIVFFVISGYLVGGLTINKIKTRGFDLRIYAIHRISRIYTVLVPALVLGGCLDLIGLHYFNFSELYTFGQKYTTWSINYAINQNLTLNALLGDLLQLQGISAPRLGSNTPLWSLSFEWWYYVFFSAIILSLFHQKKMIRIGSVALLAISLSIFPYKILAWSLFWFAGVGLAIFSRHFLYRPSALIGMTLLGLGILSSKLIGLGDDESNLVRLWIQDLITAFGFSVALLSMDRPGPSLPLASLHHRLADFSYSLYLVHFPALIFIVGFLHDVAGIPFVQQPSMASFGYFVAVCTALCVYAWLVWFAAERHTNRIRDWLERKSISIKLPVVHVAIS